MRWLTTFVLLALAAAGGLWLWAGDALAPKLGLGTAKQTDAPSAARAALAESLTPDSIRGITRTTPGADPLSLTKTAEGVWTQPGNWPVRQADAADLANAVAGLATRFRPVPLAADADLKPYGLDPAQKPVTIKADAGGKTLTLVFGQPPAASDESATARPTYLRVDNLPEVLRVGADVYARITRPAEGYRRKQLFPDADRVKVTGGDFAGPAADRAVPLLGDGYGAVRVDGPDGGILVKRVGKTPETKPDPEKGAIEPTVSAAALAGVWEIAEVAPAGDKRNFTPLKDKPDPAKLRSLLTAAPDLWADAFVTGKTDADTGLDNPERSLTITRADGTAVALRVGKVSRSSTKVDAAPPASPFAPPTPPKVTVEEYRYAKLDNNPLVFEIKADKLADLFPKPEEARDATVARFESADAVEVTVTVKGKPPVKLTKRKGNKDATAEDDKQDRWFVGDAPAEAGKVTELIDPLAKLEARGKENVIDGADAKKLAELGIEDGGSAVTVVVQDKVEGGGPPPAPRTLTFKLGKQDAEKKKLNVQLAGWPRVNVVDDAVVKLADRPVLAYRGRRLFDAAGPKLEAVAVAQPGGPGFTITKQKDAWALTAPVAASADLGKAEALAGDLTRLEVTEYVNDAPTPDELDNKYKLATPAATATLTFAGGKVRKLEVGGSPEFKPEVYARLDGGSVFTLPKAATEPITAGALGLLPLQLWSVPPEAVTMATLTRPDGAYTLAPDGANWKLTGPFDAPVPAAAAKPLFAAIATVRAEKYESINTPDPAKYGFDKPLLKAVVTVAEKDKPAATKTLIVGAATAPGAATRFATLDGGPAAAVFVVGEPLLKDADKPAFDLIDKTILTLDPATLTKLAFAGPAAETAVTLVKEGDGLKAEGQAFPVDKPTGFAAFAAFARMPVQKVVGYGPATKWAEFGLEKPEFTVTATTADGKTHALKLGKVAPGGGRYARLGDGPAAVILPPRAADDLARGKLDFVDKTLLAFDAATLTGVTRTVFTDVLELAQGAAGGWEITKPAKQKADAPLMDDLADQLSRLRADRVVAFAAKDLKPFGLDAPAAVVSLTATDKNGTKTLKLGALVDAKKPDGDRFAAVDGGPDATVGVVPGFVANRLLAPPLKFRDRTLAKFVDADKVVLDRGDRKATFAKLDGTWKLVAPLAGDAEQGDLDEFVNALAKLRADELEADKPADLKPFGLDKPEVKWTLSAGDKDVLTLLVGAKDKAGRAFAKLDKGDVVAVLDPGLTAKVLGEYRKRSVWTGVDAAQVESLVFSGAGGSFVLRKLGQTWVDAEKPTEPIDPAKVSEVLDALAGLKAERYVSDKDADLNLYGLKSPQRVIVVGTKAGAKTLHLGRPEGGTDDKKVYAKVDDAGRTDVFVLGEADAAKLRRGRAEFAGKK